MIYYICSRCGKKVPTGQKCECQKEIEKERQKQYDQTKRDQGAKKFYSSKAWHTARARAIKADHGRDVYAWMKYGKVQPGNEVHHIIPRADDAARRFDVNNLMTLSTASHAEIEQRYRNENKHEVEQELFTMLKQYRKHFNALSNESK